MNKTAIEYGDRNWPVVTGCKRGCEYCWARRLLNRFGWSFEPTLHLDRLDAPLKVKKPCKVLTCFTGDLFGPWIKPEWGWQKQVIEVARQAHWHQFLFLTKYPENLARWEWPPNAWVGATATDASSILHALCQMENVKAPVRFLSLEPLLGPVDPQRAWPVEWIIVGAQTGPAAVPPQLEWIETIARFAKRHKIALFEKNNLKLLATCQEFPKVAA